MIILYVSPPLVFSRTNNVSTKSSLLLKDLYIIIFSIIRGNEYRGNEY
jgi:hypothetical protein